MEKSGVKCLATSFSVPVSAMVFLCLSSPAGIKTRSSFSFHRRLCAQNPSKYLLVVVEYLAALQKQGISDIKEWRVSLMSKPLPTGILSTRSL